MRARSIFVRTWLALALGATWTQAAEETGANGCRTLRVVLYPFVPAEGDYFFQIQHDFEKENPEIRLEIIDLSANYYDPGKPGFVLSNSADVYELDSILLADAVGQNRIQPLSDKMPINPDTYLKNAQLAATWGGAWYGIPHWVCGYFLFFKSSDPQADSLRSMKNLSDLEAIVGPTHAARNGLLLDMMGKLSLGELYLAAAFDKYSDWDHVRPHIEGQKHPEPQVETDLWRVLKLCDTNFGRNSQYHYAAGFYGRQFSHEHGRLMVGYSEALFALLDETQNACESKECLTDAKLDVTGFPLDDAGMHQICWVDLLTVDQSCTGQKLKDAINFLTFVNREDEMLKALKPDLNTSRPARYLLPAVANLYLNQELLKNAPLYPKLRSIIEPSVPPVAPQINSVLRSYGAEIDRYLTTNKPTFSPRGP